MVRKVAMLLVVNILLPLAVIEIIFIFFLKDLSPAYRVEMPVQFEKRIVVPDSTLGFKLKPNAETFIKRVHNGTTYYREKYSTDKFGRRQTGKPLSYDKQKFALFFGGSAVDGLGIGNEGTLPSQFDSQSKLYRAYNYGLMGSGVQNVYGRLLKLDLRSQVAQAEGVAFYVATVSRFIGDLLVMKGDFRIAWAKKLPKLTLNPESSEPLFNLFSDAEPFRMKTHELLRESKVMQLLARNIPARITSDDISQFVDIVAASRDLFLSKFPTSQFYFVVHPFSEKSVWARVKLKLREKQINYIEFKDFDVSSPGFLVPYDGHPSPLFNEALSKRLLAHLEGATVN